MLKSRVKFLFTAFLIAFSTVSSASLTQIINYNNAANFTEDVTKVEFTTLARLLTQSGSATFTQAFTTDAGFTYDAAKTEFNSGLMRQIDQTAANSIFGNNFVVGKDLGWHKSGGSLTGTLNGTPTFTGGKMVCAGTQGVYYVRNTNTVETHKFLITPNYTTSPPTNINLVTTWNGTNNNDQAALSHSSAGNTLRATIKDSSAVAIVSAVTLGGAWEPTAGVTYEFMFTVDSVAGAIRVFIDGVLHGSTTPGAWTRGTAASRAYLGASPTIYDRAEASFDDYILFDDIQETGNYTPGYSVSNAIYVTDTIDLPTFSLGVPGIVDAFTSFAATDVNTPHYTIEGKYWNGAAWVASDGSFAQSNTEADVLANIATLALVGQTEISVQVVWDDTNTLSSVDVLTLDYEIGGFAVDDPTIVNNSGVDADAFVSFATVQSTPSGSDVKFVICRAAVDFYWNGSAWVVSDGTFAQANTAADVTANIATFDISSGFNIKIKAFLHSDAGTVTPTLTSVSVGYDFNQEPSDNPSTCTITAALEDILGDVQVSNASLIIENHRPFGWGNVIVQPNKQTIPFDANGEVSVPLVETSSVNVNTAQIPKGYKFTLEYTDQGSTDRRFVFGFAQVPDLTTQKLTSLTFTK